MRLVFDIPDDDPVFARYLVRHILQGAADGCRPLFVGPGALPPLYGSGIVYQEDPAYGSGIERFHLPFEVAAKGVGDCNDLVLYEVARRRAKRGNDSVTIADYIGNGSMHAQIRRGDGTVEDPSIRLGAQADWPTNFLYDLR